MIERTSKTKFEPIEKIGRNAYYVNMNIHEEEHQVGGGNNAGGGEVEEPQEPETETVWACVAVRFEGSYPTYPGVVQLAIADRYDQSAELAIQRQRESKPDDFEEYNDYCEWCKSIAKPIFFPSEGGE